jgi:hypothetical protein
MIPSALALAAALVAILLAAPAAAQLKETPLSVATLSGPAETFAKGGTWTSTKLRVKVAEGGGARALAGGRLSLLTANGNSVRMGQFTQVMVADPPAGAPTGGPLRLILDGGRIWVSVLPLTVTRAPLEIEAGPVTVAVRSGGTSLRANPDGSVLVRVYHGLAVARATMGTAWERPLKAAEELLVPVSGAAPAAGTLTSDPEDAGWVKWNSDQDIAVYGMKAPN